MFVLLASLFACSVGGVDPEPSETPTPVADDAVDSPELQAALKKDPTVIVLRLARPGAKGTTPAEFAKVQEKLSSKEGYLASSLHTAFIGDPAYASMTLTAWASMADLTRAAPDLVGSSSPTGLYQPIMALNRSTRPAVGSYSVVAPFKGSVDDYGQILRQLSEFSRVGSEFSPDWDGMVVLKPATGEPEYTLVSITSWKSLDAAQRFSKSKEMAGLFHALAKEDLIAPEAVSLLRVNAH